MDARIVPGADRNPQSVRRARGTAEIVPELPLPTFDDVESAARPNLGCHLVEQARRLACRFGAGQLIGDESPTQTPLQALAVIGRLLAWADEGDPPDLLSVRDVAAKLGTSSRSVWRMLSAEQIPAPIKIRGKTKWRAPEIEAMIELSPSNRS